MAISSVPTTSSPASLLIKRVLSLLTCPEPSVTQIFYFDEIVFVFFVFQRSY